MSKQTLEQQNSLLLKRSLTLTELPIEELSLFVTI